LRHRDVIGRMLGEGSQNWLQARDPVPGLQNEGSFCEKSSSRKTKDVSAR
jgi:hypothetical protein